MLHAVADQSNHVHFIDGAMGGYAMAASAMKAALRAVRLVGIAPLPALG